MRGGRRQDNPARLARRDDAPLIRGAKAKLAKKVVRIEMSRKALVVLAKSQYVTRRGLP